MNVSLTPELERLVNEKVESGLYQTASEVVREALRLLKDRDQAREQLRYDVQAGFDQCSRTPAAPIAIPARFSGDSEKATVKETVAFHRFPSRLERTEYKTPTVPGSVPHLLCPTRRALGRCKQPAWLHLVAKATV